MLQLVQSKASTARNAGLLPGDKLKHVPRDSLFLLFGREAVEDGALFFSILLPVQPEIEKRSPR